MALVAGIGGLAARAFAAGGSKPTQNPAARVQSEGAARPRAAPSDEGAPETRLELERRILAGIERGRQALLSLQREDGTFDSRHGVSFASGPTALALYALLRSGGPEPDEPLRRGFASVRRDPPTSTYAASLVLLALDAAKLRIGGRMPTSPVPSPESRTSSASGSEHAPLSAAGPERLGVDVAMAEQAWRLLREGQDPTSGLWGYPSPGWVDLSNSQFALLGARSAERIGLSVPSTVWSRARKGTLSLARRDGAFDYSPHGGLARGSMTLAGIMALAVCLDELGRSDRDDDEAADAIEDAFGWYEPRHDPAWNPIGPDGQERTWHHYFLYSLERVGSFLHLRSIGGSPWYEDGARFLLETQHPDGSWGGSGERGEDHAEAEEAGATAESTSAAPRGVLGSTEDTAFALLFLSRATLDTAPPLGSVITERGGVEEPAPVPRGSPELPAPSEDAPFVKDWLVLGPFPRRDSEPFATPVVRGESDLVGQERRLVQGRPWRAARSFHGVLELARAIPDVTRTGVAFAYAEVHAKRAGDALLHVGSSDGVLVWWNGDLVLSRHRHRVLRKDEDRVAVALRKGRNRLLLRVEKHGGTWMASARITAIDGSVLADVAARDP